MEQSPAAAAIWSIADWSQAVGFSRSTWYAIPEEKRPKSVRIGARLFICEQPAEYVQRMAASGSVVKLKTQEQLSKETPHKKKQEAGRASALARKVAA